MRQIKFRGQNTESKNWIIGSLLIKDETSNQIMTYVGFKHEVVPESVGQFTGLKDKNGVEIYEGDIVKKTIDLDGGVVNNWEVFFGEAGFDIKRTKENSEETTMYLKKYWKHTYEVVGNIHENPKLLNTN